MSEVNVSFLFVLLFITAPSEPPRNLSVQHSTASALTFQLKPVDKYHINGVLQGYKVKYGESKSLNDTWKSFVINVTHAKRRKRSIENKTFSFNLEGLKPYTPYTVIVLAFTVKDGVPTLAANFTTAEDGMTYYMLLNCFKIYSTCVLNVGS